MAADKPSAPVRGCCPGGHIPLGLGSGRWNDVFRQPSDRPDRLLESGLHCGAARPAQLFMPC
eukprot:7011800-Alexandrium_andersonii.AAC.1